MLDAIAYCGTPTCVSVVKEVTMSGEIGMLLVIVVLVSLFYLFIVVLVSLSYIFIVVLVWSYLLKLELKTYSGILICSFPGIDPSDINSAILD